MKLGIYSDVHVSLNSSILSRVDGYKYSARLDSIVKSFEWMYNVFRDNNVDLIINGGDLFSSDIIRPEENSAVYEALSYNKFIPEDFIVGNHDMKSKNRKFNSMAILNGYSNITVNDDINIKEYRSANLRLVYVPYYNNSDDYEKLYNLLDKFNDDYKQIIITHAAYIGETLNDYKLITSGIDKERIFNNYNVQAIFNGHIHTAKDSGKYHQIGSLVGNNFSDNYKEHYPGVIVYDTDLNEVIRYDNPHAILYYKCNPSNIKDLQDYIKNLPKNDKCVQIIIDSSIYDNIHNWMSDNYSNYNIISYRIKLKASKNEYIANNDISNIKNNLYSKDVSELLIDYLNSQESLPVDKTEAIKFINEYLHEE